MTTHNKDQFNNEVLNTDKNIFTLNSKVQKYRMFENKHKICACLRELKSQTKFNKFKQIERKLNRIEQEESVKLNSQTQSQTQTIQVKQY